MQTLNAEDVLAVASEQVSGFIRDQASARNLSVLIRHLNDELLSGDEAASEMASRALRHMGFAEQA